MERELERVIGKLTRWAKEIATHHEEIAKRNFAIGLEVAGFIETFPPRSYPGEDILGRIAESVGLSPSYLSILARTADWLYREKNAKDVVD